MISSSFFVLNCFERTHTMCRPALPNRSSIKSNDLILHSSLKDMETKKDVGEISLRAYPYYQALALPL